MNEEEISACIREGLEITFGVLHGAGVDERRMDKKRLMHSGAEPEETRGLLLVEPLRVKPAVHAISPGGCVGSLIDLVTTGPR